MRKMMIALALALATLAPGLASATPGYKASAERCRVAPGHKGEGRWAKCSAPDAIKASAYVRKCVRQGTPCRSKWGV